MLFKLEVIERKRKENGVCGISEIERKISVKSQLTV